MDGNFNGRRLLLVRMHSCRLGTDSIDALLAFREFAFLASGLSIY
jgi:hypothetical protein